MRAARAYGSGPGGDAEADGVPAARIEFHVFGRLVFGCVHTIDARKPDHAAAPAAGDEGAKGVIDREGEAAEEVAAVDFHGLERNLIVNAGELVRVADPGEHDAGVEQELAVFDSDFTMPAEISDLPATECFAIEETLPVGAPAPRRMCQTQERNDQKQRLAGRLWPVGRGQCPPGGPTTARKTRPVFLPAHLSRCHRSSPFFGSISPESRAEEIRLELITLFLEPINSGDQRQSRKRHVKG